MVGCFYVFFSRNKVSSGTPCPVAFWFCAVPRNHLENEQIKQEESKHCVQRLNSIFRLDQDNQGRYVHFALDLQLLAWASNL